MLRRPRECHHGLVTRSLTRANRAGPAPDPGLRPDRRPRTCLAGKSPPAPQLGDPSARLGIGAAGLSAAPPIARAETREAARIECPNQTLESATANKFCANPRGADHDGSLHCRSRAMRTSGAQASPGDGFSRPRRSWMDQIKQQRGGNHADAGSRQVPANVGLQLRPRHCIRRGRLNNQSSNTLDAMVERRGKALRKLTDCLSRSSAVFVLHQRNFVLSVQQRLC